MLIDITQDNLYISLCSRKLRADKTSYISEVEKAIAAGNKFISLCAPTGLGVSTFIDMLGTFYNERVDNSAFWGTDIVNDQKSFAKRGSCIVLTYDFQEVNRTTGYNKFLSDLADQTYMAVTSLYPNITKLSKYDWLSQLSSLSHETGKQLVLVFKNFDRVLYYVTKTRDFLNAWSRLWATLIESNRKNNFIYLAVAGTHIPEIIDRMVNPDVSGGKSLFYNLSSNKISQADTMFGWCGITYEEMTTILKASFSELDSDELYDWCGRYDGGLVKPNSLFTSIEAKDLFITSNVTNAVSFIRDTLNNGFGNYLLCGDIGIARLLNGETVSMKAISVYDPRLNSKYTDEIYAFTRRFLQRLYAEGLISLVPKSDSRLDVANLVNTEIMMAVPEEINSYSDYLNAICQLAAKRENIQEALEKNDGFVLRDVLNEYLLLQKKYLGEHSNITIWQAVNDLLSDIDNVEVIPYENLFILRDISNGYYQIIAIGVNVNDEVLLDKTLNLRLKSNAFNKKINGYTGRLNAFIYNFSLGASQEPKITLRTSLVS